MKLGFMVFEEEYKLTKRDLGILTIYVENKDTIAGSGVITVVDCPYTV
jgi:hypothetical protein